MGFRRKVASTTAPSVEAELGEPMVVLLLAWLSVVPDGQPVLNRCRDYGLSFRYCSGVERYAEKIAGFDRVLVINVTQENVEETHMNHGPQSRTSAEHRETERKQNMGTLDKTGEKHENN
jgi:hypothetical protein